MQGLIGLYLSLNADHAAGKEMGHFTFVMQVQTRLHFYLEKKIRGIEGEDVRDIPDVNEIPKVRCGRKPAYTLGHRIAIGSSSFRVDGSDHPFPDFFLLPCERLLM
jgi:hypothetical protein